MFRKLIQASVAASLIASPMIATSAQAQARDAVTTVRHTQNGTVVRTVNRNSHGTIVKKTTYSSARPAVARKWAKGQRFDRRYARNYRVVDYRQYRNKRLYAPPRGYRWVRSGNDAVLVGVTSGIVSAVIAGAILR